MTSTRTPWSNSSQPKQAKQNRSHHRKLCNQWLR